MKPFADQLKSARRKHQLTQQELAQESKLSLSCIQFLEEGRTKRPSFKTTLHLARCLGESFEFEFDGQVFKVSCKGPVK